MLHSYGYCSIVLVSREEIDELPRMPATASGQLSFLAEPGPQADVHDWDYQSVHGGEATISIARLGDQHLLQFYDGVEFCVDPQRGAVVCSQSATSSVRHHLLDQVLPRLLNAQGSLMVHGSAVLTDRGAVVFVGESGYGKSTLAAAFNGHGHTLLTDDCMRLSVDRNAVVQCTPTYPSLRLWPDSSARLAGDSASKPMSDNGQKWRFEPVGNHAQPGIVPVAGLCLLGAPSSSCDSVELVERSATHTAAGLISQCFRLDLTNAAATATTFEQAMAVVDHIPAVELRYPRDFAQLPDVVDAVLNWMSGPVPANLG